MAAYTGRLARIYLSVRHKLIGWRRGCEFQTTVKRSGNYAIEALAGHKFEPIWIGCNAGSTTISVWCYPTTGATGALYVFRGKTFETAGQAASVGTGAWEQLSVTFTAVKAVYFASLMNLTTPNYAPGRARHPTYFDDILVE